MSTSGFTRRTEQKKESIRQAALELFREHGFKKVSIEDIARKAGVSHVTIYNHFGGKEELVRDTIKHTIQDVVAKSQEIIESDLPYLEKMNRLIFSKTSVARLFKGQLIKQMAEDLPEISRYMEQIRQTVTGPLTDKLVEEGKRLKYIKADLAPRSIELYLTIIRNGIYADKRLLESIEIDTKLAQDLNYLWLYGLIEKQE